MSTFQDLFTQLRKLYGGASEVLLDTERLLDPYDYVSAHGKKQNQIGIERSGNVSEPDLWAPQWIARFFHHREKGFSQRPLVYVACILSDGGAMDYTLPGAGEPVITAGIIRYRREDEKNADWRYWMAKYWVFGTRHPIWPALHWKEIKTDKLAAYHIERLETFAVPLVEIQKRADLDARVIQPLAERAGLSVERDEREE